MRAAMASCMLSSKVATVLRNIRWAHIRYGGDDEHHPDPPLIAGLKSLRRCAAASGQHWRDDVEPLLYLRPFLATLSAPTRPGPPSPALRSLRCTRSSPSTSSRPAPPKGAVIDAVTDAASSFEQAGAP
ncbi:hypothetical protein PR202_gn00770 [Eleusine coracana subsp. coracana]|uniref:Uncharacterized protein n=1 Tax=Eleusine coracana subsp. coracana TaxID=191504 RepID=A0AAV5G0D1_ELECO|nr:hypothetical protein PR202_gn00770 [Eleusine coracana subsp. coracana]